MNQLSEPEVLNSFVCIYPLCKRLLLHTAWQSHDFTGTQRLILLTSAISGRLTMTHLAETIACSKEQATRAVAPLVEAGYLQRIYDRQNRTRVYIELTDTGHRLICQHYESSAQELRQVFSGLSSEDQAALVLSLKTIYRLLGHLQPADPEAS